MFFFVSTETAGGDINKMRSLIFELPDQPSYCSTDLQIKILERKAFEHWHANSFRLSQDQISYSGNEVIPAEKRTEKIKPDIVIPSGEWI